MTNSTEVVLLTTGNDLGRIAARRLAVVFPNLKIITERPVSRVTLLRRRIVRLGLVRVAGQVAFILLARLLQLASRKRVAEILRSHDMAARWPENCEHVEVPSANSAECLACIARLNPRVILLLGTRIIDRATLGAIVVPLINYHAGITP